MTCEQCDIIKKEEKGKLYEDEKVVALLSSEPCTRGHVLVMPKHHYPIIENIPEDLLESTFIIANKISTALFDVLQVQGTNILLNNGIAAGQESAHFMVHVIPRNENDGLNFLWQSKQLSQEEMTTIEIQIKQQIDAIENGGRQEVIEDLKKEAKKIDKEDYQIKHITRVP